MKLELKIKLAPYEMQIVSGVTIQILEQKEEYVLSVYLRLLMGEEKRWAYSSYYFVDSLRKQLMLWRSLSLPERQKYERGIRI
jgi:hypothetical protein